MKPKPLKHYGQPRYPTRLEVLADPDLLRRHPPPAWQAMPGMAGSIALLLAANTTVQGADKKATDEGAVAIVAPIFEHGEGRGAIGCVVVAPPVFLSEEEAWQVIDEEMARRGVKLTQRAVPLKRVQIPERFQTLILENIKGEWHGERRIADVTDSAKPFLVDRENPEKHIAVEFVSQRDYYSKAGAPSNLSTLQSYDFRETAKNLAEEIRKQGQEKVYLGVLYDPLAKWELPKNVKVQSQKEWEQAMRRGFPESKRQPRTTK